MEKEGADGVFFGDPEGGSETHNLDLNAPEPLFQQEERDPNQLIAQGDPRVQEPLTPARETVLEPDGEILDPTGQPEAPRKRTIQARIDKLVRRNHEKTNENEMLRAQIATLGEQVLQLSSQLSQKPNPRQLTSPGNVTPGADIFGAEASETPSGEGVDIVRTIEAVVQRSVAPLIERERSRDAIGAIRAQHEASFAEAVQEYPDLADSTSELRQTFNALFDGADPQLQGLPNAPVLIAHMARGLVADQRRSEQRQSEKKRAAAVHTPRPAPTDAPSSPGRVSKDTLKAVEEARKRLRAGSRDLADFKLVREFGRVQQFGPKAR